MPEHAVHFEEFTAPGTGDRFEVQLAASAEREVINDIIVATLFIEREGADQAKLGALVNEAMSWALAEAGKAKEVKVTTGQYTTFPVYTEKSNGVSAWRVRQKTRLCVAVAS